MILDSSVILAIVQREPGFESLVAKLDGAEYPAIGTPTLVETEIVLEARLGIESRTILEHFVQDFQVAAVSFGEEHWREAARAFRRFGKGRHPAALNFGDCLAYAVAHLADRPLLCVGDDFPRTDLALA